MTVAISRKAFFALENLRLNLPSSAFPHLRMSKSEMVNHIILEAAKRQEKPDAWDQEQADDEADNTYQPPKPLKHQPHGDDGTDYILRRSL